MQIVKLELSHFNFYCPATGEMILKADEMCNDKAKSLQGYWVDEIIEEPYFNNKEFEAAWREYDTTFRDENDDENIS